MKTLLLLFATTLLLSGCCEKRFYVRAYNECQDENERAYRLLRECREVAKTFMESPHHDRP